MVDEERMNILSDTIEVSNVESDTSSERKVMDIEEIVKAGEKMCSCPYFSLRSLAANADVIVLPYQSILHKGTRSSLELNIESKPKN